MAVKIAVGVVLTCFLVYPLPIIELESQVGLTVRWFSQARDGRIAPLDSLDAKSSADEDYIDFLDRVLD